MLREIDMLSGLVQRIGQVREHPMRPATLKPVQTVVPRFTKALTDWRCATWVSIVVLVLASLSLSLWLHLHVLTIATD